MLNIFGPFLSVQVKACQGNESNMSDTVATVCTWKQGKGGMAQYGCCIWLVSSPSLILNGCDVGSCISRVKLATRTKRQAVKQRTCLEQGSFGGHCDLSTPINIREFSSRA